MDEHYLKKLFSRLSIEGAPDPRGCPDLHELAGYVEGRLGQERRERLEAHLADCPHCLGQVRFLVRSEAEVVARPAPAPQTQQPLEVLWGATRRWLRPPRRPALVPLAAAAGLLLAVVVTLQLAAPGSSPVESTAPAPAERTVRQLPPVSGAVARPEVVAPGEGVTVAREALLIAWEPVPEALSYSVRLVDGGGALVWEDETEAISTTVPTEVELAPGERYFVWVAAHLRSGLRERSSAVGFRIATE